MVLAVGFGRPHSDLPAQAPPSTPATAAVKADSAAIRLAAEADVLAFLDQWREAWLQSHKSRGSRDQAVFEDRIQYLHCDVDPRTGALNAFSERIPLQYRPIALASRTLSKCPSWLLDPAARTADEADSPDASLTTAARTRVRNAREQLLLLLHNAQRTLPRDGWITGQRVRFLLDQGRLSEARAAAVDCGSDRTWCSLLQAMVLARFGMAGAADSLFQSTLSAMPVSERCIIADIRALLPEPVRSTYASRDCETRESLTTRYWWLADPLHGTPFNERRAEHHARRVRVMLHSSLDRDERYAWSAAAGGAVIAEMLVRYGWPTAAVWGGNVEDKSHDSWLTGRNAQPSPPYSTAE